MVLVELALMVPLMVTLPVARSSMPPPSRVPFASMRERVLPMDWTSMVPLDSMVTPPPSPSVPATPFTMILEPGSSVTLPA